MLELRQSEFVVEDAERDPLAIALTACLADPDTELRGGVVFGGLSKWMRDGSLAGPTLQQLYAILLDRLASESHPKGLEQPFAALVLTELARTDHVDPWMVAQHLNASLAEDEQGAPLAEIVLGAIGGVVGD